MSQGQGPSIATHSAVKVTLPEEPNNLAVGRADLPVPSLWAQGVSVKRNIDGKQAVVVRVDHAMMLFRAFYPDEPNDEGGMGRFSPRTEWMHCKEWTPETTFSAEELARQATAKAYEAELAKLDEEQLALAQVMCEDPDPAKSMAKLKALMRAKIISLGSSEAVAVQAVADVKPAKK